jgi:hypothetical protein
LIFRGTRTFPSFIPTSSSANDQKRRPSIAYLIVIVVIIRASRGTLVSAARVNVPRRSILRLRREKYIIARPAQPRSVVSEAGGDAICVRYVGSAEPKHIRGTDLTLLLRPLSALRSFSGKKKRKRCDAAGYLMRSHTTPSRSRSVTLGSV